MNGGLALFGGTRTNSHLSALALLALMAGACSGGNAVTHAPVAKSQSLAAYPGVPLTILLEASDEDGDALTFSIVEPPRGGTLTGQAVEQTYLADATFHGADTFTFRARDGSAESEAATVAIEVYGPEKPGPIKVFVLAGQSNIEGHGDNTDLDWIEPALKVKRDDVYIETIISNAQSASTLGPGFGEATTSFGPELKLGNVLGDALGESVYFYKATKGGTTLSEAQDWRPTSQGGAAGNLYAQMIEGFTQFKKAQFTDAGLPHEVAGFVWFQGENDTFNGYETSYAQNLTNLIAAVRTDLNLPNLPVIIVQINDTWGTTGDVVMQAQATVANKDARSALVVTGDLRPYFHYGSQSYVEIGDRIARAVFPFLNRPAAQHDEYTVSPGGSLVIPTSAGVLGNDTGDARVALLVRNVEHGTLDLRADGSFSYTPNAAYRGPDTFQYKIYSKGIGGNIAHATLYVRDTSDALAVRFTFDETTVSDIHDSASGLATRVVSPGLTVGHSGIRGQAAHFDGSGLLHYLSSYPIPSFLSLGTDADFSIAVWVKPDGATTEEQILVTNMNAYNFEPGFGLSLGGATGSFRTFLSSFDHGTKQEASVGYTATSGAIYDGGWHHLCTSVAFSQGKMYLYFDGALVGEQDISSLSGDLNRFETAIGDGSGGGDANSLAYKGYLDDLRVYRRALSQGEVQALAN